MHLTATRRSGLAIGCALLVLSSCGGPDPMSGDFASLAILDGDGQVGTVGTELPSPLVVQVKGANGEPQGGITVTFVVTAGGGSLFVEAVTTTSEGLARDFWTLGTSTAEPQRVEVRAIDPATGEKRTYVTFTATAVGGAPVAARPAGPFVDQCSGIGIDTTHDYICLAGQAPPYDDPRFFGLSFPGAVVTPAPSVVVRDQYGNPVSGVTVTFDVIDAGGSATGATSTTDAEGIATVGSWTVPTVASSVSNVRYELLATADGAPDARVFFGTVVVPGVATQLVALGNNQTAPAGTKLATIDLHCGGCNHPHTLPSVFAVPLDAYGNGTPLLQNAMGTPTLHTVPIEFRVTGGGGCVEGGPGDCTAVQTLGTGDFLENDYDNGHPVAWVLGAVAGVNTITATAPGLPPITFTATGQ